MKQIIKRLATPEKLFFLACCVFSVIISYFVTQNCIDSDASSELVLSSHLAQTGRIMSRDWGYSTELRVLNTQLVYAPLFFVFESWHLVRFFGALILQGILVASLYAFVHLVSIDKKVFYWSAGLYLLPVSVCYGRIVLYNCYYIPHIAISLCIVGLVFAKSKENAGKQDIIRSICLIVLSFLGGLGGVRQMLMTHAPVILAVFIYYFMDDFVCRKKDRAYEKKRLVYFGNAIVSSAFFFFGFLINSLYFSKIFEYSDYTGSNIGLLSVDKIKDICYGYFHHFGFRDEIKLMTVLGVLSVLGVFLGIACVIVSIVGIAKYKKDMDVSRALPCVFFISYVAVMLLVFAVLGKGFYFVLYFTPVVAWMIPVFSLQAVNIPKETSALNLGRILPCAAMVIIMLNGVINGVYYLDHTKFEQKYEGLVFKDRTIVEKLDPVVDFLKNNGYERGYATFWNANVVTEMSDGAVRFVNVHFDSSKGAITYNPWLTLKTNRTLTGTKDFVLLEADCKAVFELRNDLSGCELVYSDDSYIVYEIKS